MNGAPLITGSRVHTVDDFGFVVLEIDWLFPRDSGEYMCRATNKWGSDTTKCTLTVKCKRRPRLFLLAAFRRERSCKKKP